MDTSSSSSDSTESIVPSDCSAVEYVSTRGHREDTMLYYVPSEKQLYKYNSASVAKGGHYLCVTDNCTCRIYIKDNLCFKPNNTSHNHGFNDNKYNELVALNEIKSKIAADRKAPLRQIFNEVMSR